MGAPASALLGLTGMHWLGVDEYFSAPALQWNLIKVPEAIVLLPVHCSVPRTIVHQCGTDVLPCKDGPEC